jgi:hypothetical protein
MKDSKGFCYAADCGPVVQTGFHHEQYFVCRRCKSEITEHLKKQIEARNAGNEPEKEDDDDDEPYWGL